MQVLHDFYRSGEESAFHFDARDMAKKGHDFKDYICPDAIEKNSDYLKLGDKFCRVIFLKDYASYIKDSMVSELTDLNRNMMLSIDVIPIPTDEAVCWYWETPIPAYRSSAQSVFTSRYSIWKLGIGVGHPCFRKRRTGK